MIIREVKICECALNIHMRTKKGGDIWRMSANHAAYKLIKTHKKVHIKMFTRAFNCCF